MKEKETKFNFPIVTAIYIMIMFAISGFYFIAEGQEKMKWEEYKITYLDLKKEEIPQFEYVDLTKDYGVKCFLFANGVSCVK